MSDLQVKIEVLEARGLPPADRNGLSDPFVVAKFRGLGKMMTSVQTSIAHNNLNPVWNQELVLYPQSNNDVLLLKVYDHDPIGRDNLLGMTEVPLANFFQRGFQDYWVQLMQKKGSWKSFVGGQATWLATPGQLHFRLCFGLANQGSGLAGPQSMPQTYANPGLSTGYVQSGVPSTGYVQPSSTGYVQSSSPTGYVQSSSPTGYVQSGVPSTSSGYTGYANPGLSTGYAHSGIPSSSTSTGYTTSAVQPGAFSSYNTPTSTGYSTSAVTPNSGAYYPSMTPQPFGAQYAATHAKGLVITGENNTFNTGFQPIGVASGSTMTSTPMANPMTTTSGFQPVQHY